MAEFQVTQYKQSLVVIWERVSRVVQAEYPRALGLESEPYATSLPPRLSSQGSVVFDCFEAALGTEVQIWSYTQPRYQKELNLTRQLPGKWPQSLRGPKSWSPWSFSPLATSFLLSPPSQTHPLSGKGLSYTPPQSQSPCLLSPGDIAFQCLGRCFGHWIDVGGI